jgi:two-component system, NtrC family, sensor kinase
MKLAPKITILILMPFVVLLVVLGFRATRREVMIYQTEIARDLTLTARALRVPFAEVWRLEGQAVAERLLAGVEPEPGGMTVRWVAGEPGATEARDKPVVRIAAATGTPGRISVRLPIAEMGIPPGSLELSRPLDQEAQLVRDVIREQSLSTLLALVVAAGLATAVGVVFVGTPVQSLVRHVRTIGQGDLSQPIALSRSDELGELAREIDAMRRDLAGAREQLIVEADARIRALDHLRHADRLSTVGRLAAGLAHELGTPLNVVAGRAKMIASGRLALDASAANAEIIGTQTERMTKIIRDLLDFARPASANKGRVDLGELSRSVCTLLGPLAKKCGVRLRVEGAETPRVIEVDAGQLEQVLANMVVNGVDASPSGGEVVVSLHEQQATAPPGYDGPTGRYLRLDVRDHGTGIRKEDVEHVFEPFFTTKDVNAGTGLGLSVAHGIVRDHGGWIAVESEAQRGSCFSVYLPLSVPT